jgi:hypothetical protein
VKRITAILFIVSMISTPCLAQVEPEGSFSIEGTLWSTGQIETANWKGTIYLGFYQGDIYFSYFYGWYDLYHLFLKHSYGDLGTVSYFFMIGEPPWPPNPDTLMAIGGLMSPLGFGTLFQGGAIRYLPWAPVMLPVPIVLRKIEDNWDPSGWEGGY